MKKATAFWDASALVPICVQEVTSSVAVQHLKKLAPVVWWGTPVEIQSAIFRLYRQKLITEEGRKGGITRLETMRRMWREISAEDSLRDLAIDLIGSYPLKAGDSLQLAASLIWCDKRPARKTFVCSDQRLARAATSVGFAVLDISASLSRL
jgi:predicted nucleic acid-binding protein